MSELEETNSKLFDELNLLHTQGSNLTKAPNSQIYEPSEDLSKEIKNLIVERKKYCQYEETIQMLNLKNQLLEENINNSIE